MESVKEMTVRSMMQKPYKYTHCGRLIDVKKRTNMLAAMALEFAKNGNRETGYITFNSSRRYYTNQVGTENDFRHPRSIDLMKGVVLKEFTESYDAILEMSESDYQLLAGFQNSEISKKKNEEWTLYIRTIGHLEQDEGESIWVPDRIFSLDLVLEESNVSEGDNNEVEFVQIPETGEDPGKDLPGIREADVELPSSSVEEGHESACETGNEAKPESERKDNLETDGV